MEMNRLRSRRSRRAAPARHAGAGPRSLPHFLAARTGAAPAPGALSAALIAGALLVCTSPPPSAAANMLSAGFAGEATAANPAAGSGGFRLVSASPDRVVFTYEGEGTAQRTEDGRLFVEDERHATVPIAPSLEAPQAAAWIALPPGTDARVSVEVVRTEPLAWPAEMSRAERRAVERALAGPGWSADAASWMHNQWGTPVRFVPLLLDGAGGLLFAREARFVVEIRPAEEGTAVKSRRARGRDAFESAYRALFLNYDAGKSWRRAAPAHAAREPRQETDWFTSTPNPWVKVFVNRRGIHSIPGEDLDAAGIALDAVDPVTLRLFRPRPLPLPEDSSYQQAPRWMIEVPIEVAGGDDGTFGPTDEIRFVGQAGDGYLDELGVDPSGPDLYFRDPYDGRVVYWLTWGGTFQGAPKRIPLIDAAGVSEPYSNLVSDRMHFEEDRFWEPRPYPIEPVGPGERPAAWERYWWLSLTATRDDPEQIVRLNLLDPVIDHPVRVRLRFNATIPFDTSTAWPDHAVRVRLNGTPILETDRLEDGRPWNELARRDADTTGIWLREGEQELRLNAPYRPLSLPGQTRVDNVLFAWAEMDYTRRLAAHGDTIAFQAGGPLRSSVQSLEITGFTTDDLLLFDATDPFAPRRLQPVVVDEGGTRRLRFRAELDDAEPSRFLAAARNRLIRPALARKLAPGGGWLRDRTAPAQMIILTHRDFLASANRLAEARRAGLPDSSGRPDRSPADVAVVTVDEVYDEFSFGRLDPTAIRNFFQCARDNWNGGDPERGPDFALLFGDAYYDYRDHQRRGGKNYVPTYEGYWDETLSDRVYTPQFGSDDYFFFLDPGFALDLWFGRLPVRTAAEAEDVVDKVLGYETTANVGPWRGRVTLVADDLCQGTRADVLGATHMVQTELLVPLLPDALQQDKVYLYEFGTQCVYDRKPLAAAALLERMNQGTLVVNFTGHGSDEQIADERVLELASVPGLTNADRPFLFFTASCSVGKYDFFGVGLGEALVLHSGGGAIAVISASAIAYSGANSDLNQRLFRALFPDGSVLDPRPLGEAAFVSKNGQGGVLNSRRYVLLGDPVTRLATPRRDVGLRLERTHSGTALGDTLERGVLTTLRGQVRDASGQLDRNYDGDASVRVYDSAFVRHVGSGNFSYELVGAPIYHDTTSVVGGEFALSFVVPTALRTGERGPAQIFVHASGEATDAGGSLPSVLIPERAAPPSDDAEGPEITLRFLQGSPAGDAPRVVPAEAEFLAEFHDTSGVNITGLVGSRSVIMEVERDGSLVFVRDLAEGVTFLDGYRRAQVQAALPASLSPGAGYQLVLRASDNRNNGGRVSLPFTLEEGGATGFALEDVFVFPNPCTDGASFHGTITGPADVEVLLFTLSGRRIGKLRAGGVTPRSFALDGVPWDGRDDDGDKPANGVYLYKLTVRPADGSKARSVEGRLVVSR